MSSSILIWKSNEGKVQIVNGYTHQITGLGTNHHRNTTIHTLKTQNNDLMNIFMAYFLQYMNVRKYELQILTLNSH